MSHFLVILVLFLSSSATRSTSTSKTYNIVDYGAKPNGDTDSTKPFLEAWKDACGSNSSANLYVPPGKFLLRNVIFQGPCKNHQILVDIYGTLIAPLDYKVIGGSSCWIEFKQVDGVRVDGGILDGRGSALWDCKAASGSCLTGARTLGFTKSKNMEINGLTSVNSQLFHIAIDYCENVKISGVKISAPGDSPNTDGIHVQRSSGVTITNCRIGTGDDCISVGPGASNLWIEQVACGPGHGISIGSLGRNEVEEGVQNVTVRTVAFTNTENGMRIKSWGRTSTGFARKITFQHATMTNVKYPIIIDQNYCPHDKGCPGQESGVKISDVTYQDIHGTSATELAVKMKCSKKEPCTGIRLEDVKLTYNSEPAASSCDNADGTVSGLHLASSCLQ